MRICDSSIRVRMDSETKQKASAALEKMGLSVSDALRLFLVRVGEEERIPFDVEIPNAETRMAMKELEAGGGTSCATLEESFKQLEI